MKFNKKAREKQIEFLDKCADQEGASLVNGIRYSIVSPKETETVHCADTALMLLETKYKDINVFLKKN